MKTIEIKWEGPFILDDVQKMQNETDFGLYAAFGPHNVYGDRVLLYIGKAEQQTFGVRIPQHRNEDWWGSEEIYIGRIGSDRIPSIKDWDEEIDYSETKMIQYCLPSWNASKLNNYKSASFGEAIIVNEGVRLKAFPRILAEWIFLDSSFKKNTWKAYSNKTAKF